MHNTDGTFCDTFFVVSCVGRVKYIRVHRNDNTDFTEFTARLQVATDQIAKGSAPTPITPYEISREFGSERREFILSSLPDLLAIGLQLWA